MAMDTKGRTIILTGKTSRDFIESAKNPSCEVAIKRDRYLDSVKKQSGSILSQHSSSGTTKECSVCGGTIKTRSNAHSHKVDLSLKKRYDIK